MSTTNPVDFCHKALALAKSAGWGSLRLKPMEAFLLRDLQGGNHLQARCSDEEMDPIRLFFRAQPQVKGDLALFTLEPDPESLPGRDGVIALLKQAGVQTVFLGGLRPEAQIQGKGRQLLLAAGFKVPEPLAEDSEADLNLIHHFTACHGRPLFAAKIATTLDGRIATRSGHSKWITGESARADVMQWRARFPAISVGAGTVRADNPSLTARLPDRISCPIRFIWDPRGTLLAEPVWKVFTDQYATRTILLTGDRLDSAAGARLEDFPFRHWVLPCLSDGTLCLDAFQKRCWEQAIQAVYFEGGRGLLSRLLAHNALDYLFSYRAPLLLADDLALNAFSGGHAERLDGACRLYQVKHNIFGNDQLMRGFLHAPI